MGCACSWSFNEFSILDLGCGLLWHEFATKWPFGCRLRAVLYGKKGSNFEIWNPSLAPFDLKLENLWDIQTHNRDRTG